MTLTFKSLKPALTYSHPVSLTDTILSIKEELHILHPDDLPTAESQRLLLKGKALADQKLLKEYSIKEGDTLTLMFKAPPMNPTTAQPLHADSMSTNAFASAGGSLDPDAKPSGGGRRHQRIPSVVLSPSPETRSPGEKPKDLLLDLDADMSVPLSPVLKDELLLESTYHDTISQPEFWEKLLTFLQCVPCTVAPVYETDLDVGRNSRRKATRTWRSKSSCARASRV